MHEDITKKCYCTASFDTDYIHFNEDYVHVNKRNLALYVLYTSNRDLQVDGVHYIYRKQKSTEGFYVYLYFFYKADLCTNVMKQLNMKKYNIHKHTNTCTVM